VEKEFVKTIELLVQSGDSYNAVYEIIHEFGGLFRLNKIDLINNIIKSVDVTKQNEDTLVAFLCGTYRIKDKVEAREEFFERVKSFLLTDFDTKIVDEMLRGLN
jgi:hypothetical protein